jgi:hypothetical protein
MIKNNLDATFNFTLKSARSIHPFSRGLVEMDGRSLVVVKPLDPPGARR